MVSSWLFVDTFVVRSKRKMLGWVTKLRDDSWSCLTAAGSSYNVTRSTNGQYEIKAYQSSHEGIAALWSLRPPKPQEAGGVGSDAYNQRRFTFSPLQEGVSCRPFAASLTQQTLKIFHEYKTRPDTSAASSEVKSSLTEAPISRRFPSSRQLMTTHTSESLQHLIIITGKLRSSARIETVHIRDVRSYRAVSSMTEDRYVSGSCVREKCHLPTADCFHTGVAVVLSEGWEKSVPAVEPID